MERLAFLRHSPRSIQPGGSLTAGGTCSPLTTPAAGALLRHDMKPDRIGWTVYDALAGWPMCQGGLSQACLLWAFRSRTRMSWWICSIGRTAKLIALHASLSRPQRTVCPRRRGHIGRCDELFQVTRLSRKFRSTRSRRSHRVKGIEAKVRATRDRLGVPKLPFNHAGDFATDGFARPPRSSLASPGDLKHSTRPRAMIPKQSRGKRRLSNSAVVADCDLTTHQQLRLSEARHALFLQPLSASAFPPPC